MSQFFKISISLPLLLPFSPHTLLVLFLWGTQTHTNILQSLVEVSFRQSGTGPVVESWAGLPWKEVQG